MQKEAENTFPHAPILVEEEVMRLACNKKH